VTPEVGEVLLEEVGTPRVGVWIKPTRELTFCYQTSTIEIAMTQILHQFLLSRIPFLFKGKPNGFVTLADADRKWDRLSSLSSLSVVVFVPIELVTASDAVDNRNGQAIYKSLS
jgi:hypothetical protein